ncbi:uncharacterized protein LOC135822636 isoform X2 [Sycon ciliatum]|uniref:uncharacterized protein LOC135822636 isoform X2 n=1 Tax=Sycon ciliatum TaxID=27933 RepID=UPI0031F6367E
MASGGVDICAGQEDGGLRGLDHEFDKRIWVPGPLNGREGPHRDVVQVVIFKTCCKHLKLPTFGTCFLAKTAEGSPLVLNGGAAEDEYACFFTVAHNLYCKKHACYVAKIALVHMNKPGTPAERTPRTKSKDMSHNDKIGFYRVPQEFKQCKTRDGLCQSDYGLIVVRRDELLDLDLQHISLSLPTSLVGESAACYPHGVVCGYPVYVFQKPNTSEYNLGGESAGFKERPDVKRYLVVGAQYCSVPSGSSDSVQESDAQALSKEDRRQLERHSDGIFSFPQNHFDEECEKYCPQSSASAALYRYYIDTSPGNSGSPVYVPMQDGTFVVVGLHRGTWYYHHKNDVDRATDCNVAVRLTDTVLKRMKDWLAHYISKQHGDPISGDDGDENGAPLDDGSDILMDVDNYESLPFLRGLLQADGNRKSNVVVSNITKKVEQSGTFNINATGNGHSSTESVPIPESSGCETGGHPDKMDHEDSPVVGGNRSVTSTTVAPAASAPGALASAGGSGHGSHAQASQDFEKDPVSPVQEISPFDGSEPSQHHHHPQQQEQLQMTVQQQQEQELQQLRQHHQQQQQELEQLRQRELEQLRHRQQQQQQELEQLRQRQQQPQVSDFQPRQDSAEGQAKRPVQEGAQKPGASAQQHDPVPMAGLGCAVGLDGWVNLGSMPRKERDILYNYLRHYLAKSPKMVYTLAIYLLDGCTDVPDPEVAINDRAGPNASNFALFDHMMGLWLDKMMDHSGKVLHKAVAEGLGKGIAASIKAKLKPAMQCR